MSITVTRPLRGMLAVLAFAAWPAMMTPSVAQQPSPEQIEIIRQSCRSDFISHCSGVQPGSREALECLQRNAAQLSAACRTAVSAAAPSPEPPRPTAAAAPPPPPSQDASQDQLTAVRKACTVEDLLSHCSWIQPNSPELLLCLRANAAKVSPACQVAVSAAPSGAGPAPGAAPAVVAPPPPAAVTAAPPPAVAPTPAPRPAAKQPSQQQIGAIRAACRSDFISRCPGVQPGGRDALQCLERNRAQVSPSCQNALAAVGGGTPAATTAPGAAPPATASPAAFELRPLRQLRPREEIGILRACGPDVRSLCAGIQPGGGRIIACLAGNASQLGPQCRGALAQAQR